MFLQFAGSISTFIVSNLIFSLCVFLIIWPVQKYLFKNNFRWQYAVLILFLARIILPVDFGFSFNPLQFLADFIAKETNSGFYSEKYVPQLLTGIQQNEYYDLNNSSNYDHKKVLLFYVWLTGSFCFLGLFIYRRKKHTKQLNTLPENDNLILEELKDKWKNIFKIHRQVRLKTGSRKLIPFTIGIIKPLIVIPDVEVTTNLKNLEAIIAHEMAHIKRFDDLRLILFGFLQSVYFFNPFIWFTVKKLCSIQEICCDHDVLQAKEISGRDYGLALLNSAVRQNHWNLIYLTTMADIKKNLTRRLIYIKGDFKMVGKKSPFAYIMLSIIAAILLFVSFPASQTVNQAAENTMPHMRSDPEFQKPLDKIKITSKYGNQISPIDKKMRHHDGIDLKAKKGTVVYASESGQVSDARFRDTYGNVILIQHKNGYQTLYSHLSEIKVEKGQQVKKGDIIGLAGNTGVSTGPHLHFEIRKDDEPLNPQDLISSK